jgi:predicted O-methyltransferase YrrM
MYSRLHLALKFLHHYFTASNSKGHGIHSPFVFEFVTKVMNDRKHNAAYEQVEQLRRKLLADTRLLEVDDLGAGSSMTKNKLRSVAAMAKHAAKPGSFGQLLFRVARYYQPGIVLELGTSLGLSTAYLSLANPASHIVTIEGSESIAAIARHNFLEMGLKNIQVTVGHFDNTLPDILRDLSTVDFVFIDGNHRQAPTENYFRLLLSKVSHNSILVFDDIHWSKEMEAAWETIKNHSSVTCTIDLFFAGFVFFRKEIMQKQHFDIRYTF